ncbi:MAG: arginine--tRNA ligase [Bacteroidota bacterium]
MKRYLADKVSAALVKLGLPSNTTIAFEKPRQAEHGDLTTNVAMVLAKQIRKNPRQLATEITDALGIDTALVKKVEVAGGGFINFTFTEQFFFAQLKSLLQNEHAYGRSNIGRGQRTLVEFVSANPTGPLTVGHGRGAVLGDTAANLLEWCGYNVEREYYYNNAGRQMRVLGDSVRLRYLGLLGDPVTFPEDYYQGEYIRETARHLMELHGDTLRNEPAEGKFKEAAESEIFADIKKSLKLLGIEFQSFFNENSLYVDGKIEELITELRTRGLVYEQEGALWLKMTELGREKDKVIVKNSGEPTYRLPDIAYHVEKFRRGYDMMIDVFGSDHIATYPDVLAALKALGYDIDKVKVLIHQFVTIVQNGEAVKMSTRKANFVTLDELIELVGVDKLIEEKGADVVRYFFLMRSANSHLNFDLGLAKQASDENPVYYLQYAHARIASLIRYAEEQGHAAQGDVHFSLLVTSSELDLIRTLLQFPDTIESCAVTLEPHHLAEYLHVVAGAFHKFYHECRVVTEEKELTVARLALCRATKAILRNGFTVLGISAPERM